MDNYETKDRRTRRESMLLYSRKWNEPLRRKWTIEDLEPLSTEIGKLTLMSIEMWREYRKTKNYWLGQDAKKMDKGISKLDSAVNYIIRDEFKYKGR